jgi:hypothetical protein
LTGLQITSAFEVCSFDNAISLPTIKLAAIYLEVLNSIEIRWIFLEFKLQKREENFQGMENLFEN